MKNYNHYCHDNLGDDFGGKTAARRVMVIVAHRRHQRSCLCIAAIGSPDYSLFEESHINTKQFRVNYNPHLRVFVPVFTCNNNNTRTLFDVVPQRVCSNIK